MTAAYEHFQPNEPQGSNTGPNAVLNARRNDRAVLDGLMMGKAKDYVFARVTGTGSAEKPQFFKWTNSGLGRVIRATNTWTGDNLTSQLWEYSDDSEATWATVHSADTITFDGSLNVTAQTGGSGFFVFIWELFAKLLNLRTSYNTHAAATGTGVHGLGSISTQAASNVAITGGTINGTAIGGSTRAAGDFTRVRETFTDLGAIANGATATCDLSTASAFALTPSATQSHTATIAFSNPPAAGVFQSWQLEIINGKRDVDARITWPTNAKWVGGSANRPSDATLELSGRNIFVVSTRDGGSRYEIQHLGKGG